MILAMPYLDASSRIEAMYWNGSLNSSSVGLYVGPSCRPNRRFGLGGWSFGASEPRLSTVSKSRDTALRALNGIPVGAAGAPLIEAGGNTPPIRDFGAAGTAPREGAGLDAWEGPGIGAAGVGVPVATRKVDTAAPDGGPPWGMESTISLIIPGPTLHSTQIPAQNCTESPGCRGAQSGAPAQCSMGWKGYRRVVWLGIRRARRAEGGRRSQGWAYFRVRMNWDRKDCMASISGAFTHGRRGANVRISRSVCVLEYVEECEVWAAEP